MFEDITVNLGLGHLAVFDKDLLVLAFPRSPNQELLL